MRMRGVICALGLWLLAAGAEATDGADAMVLGLNAWRAQNFAAARLYWQQASDAGDVQAKFLLSQLYAQGKGGALDRAKALRLLREAAEGGHMVASFNLGNHYMQGDGVPADAAQAAHWWRRAAVQGLVHAQFNLGRLYQLGEGVPADREQAAWWYRQAAAQGSERARQALTLLGESESQIEAVATPTDVEGQAAGVDPVVPVSPPKPAARDALSAEAGSPAAVSVDDAAMPALLRRLALGPDWLRRQPAASSTVQVFASDDVGSVVRFLERHRFERQVAVYPFRKAGRIWHGVVYGRFASGADARRAMDNLPAAVRKGGPWVRGFGELQGLMVDGTGAAP